MIAPRKTFISVIIIMIVLTLAAVLMIPGEKDDGKIALSWLSATVPVREMQVAEFNRLYPQYRLSIDPANQGVTKIVVQCSAKIGGDIIDFISEDNINVYYDSGLLMDFTPYAKDLGFGLDTLPESVRPLCEIKVFDKDGNYSLKQFAYPLNVMHEYIIYNKNVFDALKVPYPPNDLTWDEYIDLAKKLTVYEKGSPIPVIFGASGVRYSTILWEMGGSVMNNDGTRCELDSPQAVKAMKFYHDLYYHYKVEAPPAIKAGIVSTDGSGSKNSYDLLGAGKLAMAWGGRWYLMMLRPHLENQLKAKADWEKANPGKKYEATEPIRLGACHVPRFKDGRRYTYTGGRMAGINDLSPNKLHALNFFKYASGPEYNISMCEIADSKPPHKKYLTKEYFYNKDYPEEKQVHDISIEATQFGKVEQRSPFIDRSVITRIMQKNLDKVNNAASMTDNELKNICRAMADEINTIIVRNIERDKKLKDLYEKMLNKGAKPTAFPIK